MDENEVLQFETRLHGKQNGAKQIQAPSESSSTSTDEKRKQQKRIPKPHHPPKKVKQSAAELERIQKEKLEAENQLKTLEEDYRKQQQQQIRAKEREQELEEEIARLRNALVQQNGHAQEPINNVQHQVPYTNGNVPNEKNAQQFQSVPAPRKIMKSKLCVIL